MPIIIKDALVSDAEEMIRTGEAAFANDLMNNVIFDRANAPPDEVAEYRKYRIAVATERMDRDGSHYFKAVDDSIDRIVGYVGIYNPSVDSTVPSSVPKPACMNQDFEKEVMDSLYAAERKWIGDRKDVWYVPSMLIHPDYQGQGVGKRLLRRGLEEVDKLGQDALLEGTTAGLPLYHSCGFEVLEEILLLDGRYPLGVMMRRGKQAGHEA